jgi:hypothetical protein
MPNLRPIFFYWDGYIHPSRLQVLRDCVYSTRIYNPNHDIIIITNSLTQDLFDDKFRIQVRNWDITFFDGLPIGKEKLDKYINTNPRDFSDLFRLVLLYKFGGSYIDTDDLGIKSISNTPNLICRSYDAHTSFYNKIEADGCVPGWTREIRGWDNVNTFPRNDCWHNWEAESPFIFDMLTNNKFLLNDDLVWICGDFSWQSITNETCIKRLDTFGKEWNYGLTLLYLFEDFISVSSPFDRCALGGEMCELWKELPNVDDYEWGLYKCKRDTALDFYKKVSDIYPNLSHLWLHHKNEKEEWMLEELDEDGLYSVSTWIYWEIKQMIKCFQ